MICEYITLLTANQIAGITSDFKIDISKSVFNYFGGARSQPRPQGVSPFRVLTQTPHGPSNRFNKTELNAEANLSRCFWNAKIELFAYQINNRL